MKRNKVLSGKLIGDVVIFSKQGVEELYNKGFYGRRKGDVLEVSLAESAYLLHMGKIAVESESKELDFKKFFLKASSIVKNFELMYIAYKDIRERGYYVHPSVTGYRVYPRGKRPGSAPAEFFVFVTSERLPLPLSDLMTHLSTAGNLRKHLILAIVDEESDITYYQVKKIDIEGSCELDLEKQLSIASLLEDRVMLWDAEVSNMLHSKGFGKLMNNECLQLSLVESGYLLKNGIIGIEKQNHEFCFDEFSKLASKVESDFMMKYMVYEKLRNNRLIPKTGFKFGTHFRVYSNLTSEHSHSDYLVHAIPKDHVFSLQQLSQSVRLAHSVRKEMIYAIVSKDVDFIAIRRIRL